MLVVCQCEHEDAGGSGKNVWDDRPDRNPTAEFVIRDIGIVTSIRTWFQVRQFGELSLSYHYWLGRHFYG